MAEIIWAEPALSDLEAIADYIALDNSPAARVLVQRLMDHVEQLGDHPLSGSKLPEFKGWRCRQIIEPPCRAIYRHEKGRVHVLHLVRGERSLDRALLTSRGKKSEK